MQRIILSLTMIPILSVPILNRGDLLLRLVRSIDYPVGILLIIDNGNDQGVAAVCQQLEQESRYGSSSAIVNPAAVRVYRPGRNLGVAASWNWTMREYPTADYWLFVGNDIKFMGGDLRKMDDGVRRHPEMVIRPGNWGHSFFAVTPRCIEQVGYFEESFWPAYLEDVDQMYRIKLAGDPWADIGKASDEYAQCKAVHGEAPTFGSSTIYADAKLLDKNSRTHERNFALYCRKWGGPPGEEMFAYPYNEPGAPVTHCPRDEEHIKGNEEIWDE